VLASTNSSYTFDWTGENSFSVQSVNGKMIVGHVYWTVNL